MPLVKPFKNSYLMKWDDDEIIFSRPLSIRVVAAVCAVFLPLFPSASFGPLSLDKTA